MKFEQLHAAIDAFTGTQTELEALFVSAGWTPDNYIKYLQQELSVATPQTREELLRIFNHWRNHYN